MTQRARRRPATQYVNIKFRHLSQSKQTPYGNIAPNLTLGMFSKCKHKTATDKINSLLANTATSLISVSSQIALPDFIAFCRQNPAIS